MGLKRGGGRTLYLGIATHRRIPKVDGDQPLLDRHELAFGILGPDLELGVELSCGGLYNHSLSENPNPNSKTLKHPRSGLNVVKAPI